MADGQIVRFKIGEAFPANDQLARWMTVLAMALNDLLIVNALVMPRLEEKIPAEAGETFYLGRVAAAHLFEAATFLRKSDRIPAIKKFVAGLDDGEAEAAYRELIEIGEGGGGKFAMQLKHARNKSFHYQELFVGDHEDRERLKQALAGHAEDEREQGVGRGEIRDIPPAQTGFRAIFAYDVASEMMLPEDTATEHPGFLENVRLYINKFALVTKAALNGYALTKPAETWNVEEVESGGKPDAARDG